MTEGCGLNFLELFADLCIREARLLIAAAKNIKAARVILQRQRHPAVFEVDESH